MECKKEDNKTICTCTYSGCPRTGVCCDCIQYHKKMRQLPGCLFPEDVERTWERSYEAFADLVKQKKV